MEKLNIQEPKEMYEWCGKNWNRVALISAIVSVGVHKIIELLFENINYLYGAITASWFLICGMTVGILWCNSGKPSSKKKE